MPNNQILGFIAALLVVIVILLAININRSHRTVGDAMHDAVQSIKDEARDN
jgi:hypothetical protein